MVNLTLAAAIATGIFLVLAVGSAYLGATWDRRVWRKTLDEMFGDN